MSIVQRTHKNGTSYAFLGCLTYRSRGRAICANRPMLDAVRKRFQNHIDPVWIEEALEATGTATVRRRRLPADQVVWMVLGMGLLRDHAIERVVASLDLALPAAGGLIAKIAIAQARQRLGDEPLAYLFATTAAEWAAKSADQHRWRGLALYGADGTTLRVADTAENRETFGGQDAGAGRGESGYPFGSRTCSDGVAFTSAVRAAICRLPDRRGHPWPTSYGASCPTTR